MGEEGKGGNGEGRKTPPIQNQSGGPKLLDRLRESLRSRHYSRRTEEAYCHWVRRFIFFHKVRHPAEMGEEEINAFLSHLAVRENVSASTQNQALCALLFLYRQVIGREIGQLGEVVRARKPKRLPVVMTRAEVKAMLSHLHGDRLLMAGLMYGAGLRLMECLRLRVQDIDFEKRELLIRDGKGSKDRRAILPASLVEPLQEHLRQVRKLHAQDLLTAGDASRCRTLWTENIPMRRRSGAGSGFSPKRSVGRTARPARRDDITSMRLSCRERSRRQ
jgi:integrase